MNPLYIEKVEVITEAGLLIYWKRHYSEMKSTPSIKLKVEVSIVKIVNKLQSTSKKWTNT